MRKHCGIPKGHVGRSVKPSNTLIKKRRIYWPLLSYTRAQLNGILTQILSSTLWMFFFSFFSFAIFNKPKLTRMIPAVLKKKKVFPHCWVLKCELKVTRLRCLSSLFQLHLSHTNFTAPVFWLPVIGLTHVLGFFVFSFLFFIESRHWKCFI